MKNYLKTWWAVLLLVLAVGGIVFAISVGALVTKPATSAVSTASGVIDKTLNADNALFNYENFHDLYRKTEQQVANIRSSQQAIDRLKETYGADAAIWPKDVRSELAHLTQTLDGHKMQYERLVSEYNANSSKINRSLFKGTSLPSELPQDFSQFQ